MLPRTSEKACPTYKVRAPVSGRHSSIAGNEVADRLAKEAAQEASNFPEDSMDSVAS